MTLNIIISTLLSLGLAQCIKTLTKWYETKKIDWQTLVSSGGMPSAHSAFVISLCTALYLDQGITPLFVASCVFSLIIIRDAMGIRRAAGEHAKLLNMLLREIKKKKPLPAKQVKVLLGHTLTQVIAGCTMGLAVTLAVHWVL